MKLQNAQCPKSVTGRKVAARAIHSAYNRKKGSFVAINCTAIPVQLLDNRLSGKSTITINITDINLLGLMTRSVYLL